MVVEIVDDVVAVEKLDVDHHHHQVDNVVPNYQFLQSYDPLLLLPLPHPHHNHKDKKKENIHQKIHHVLVPFQVSHQNYNF